MARLMSLMVRSCSSAWRIWALTRSSLKANTWAIRAKSRKPAANVYGVVGQHRGVVAGRRGAGTGRPSYLLRLLPRAAGPRAGLQQDRRPADPGLRDVARRNPAVRRLQPGHDRLLPGAAGRRLCLAGP